MEQSALKWESYFNLMKIHELIELAKKIDPTEFSNTEIEEVQRFILSNNLKEGKIQVKCSVIYKAYKNWSIKPKSNLSFFMMFSAFFPLHRVARYRYYMLNVRPIALLNNVDNKKIKL